ncbi:MAG: protein kinase [Phycisphaerales bacterium]|nr:protein kinase [Phycisphaerales bacterium]MCB9856800.1 protein kinase [Phycisphaerales bacterium]MCB9862073.1 protein kinase [Phycisphaerales bacterium]
MTGPKAGDRISEYLLDEVVGTGSFGQVWKAHHHIWQDQLVAIKIPTDSQYVRNLQKEGTAIHGLRHPNIVRAIGLDPYADTPYFVMEFVEGSSLRAIIDGNKGGLPIRTAQNITVGMLQALEVAHRNNVVHRDIKPANILIHGGGQKPVESIDIADVKVTDFGLGKAGEVTTQSIMQSGSLLSEEGKSISGTLAYMSPEQRDGDTNLDGRTDLYSVGIVLFEMICGERPSGGDMPSHIRDGLPSWVDRVYSRLYTRRDRRFASAADVLREIESTSVPPRVAVATAYSGTRPPPPPTMERPTGVPTRCPKCSTRIERDDNFCIMCGEQVVKHPRRCTNCHGYPAAEDRFCIFCGTPLPEAGR